MFLGIIGIVIAIILDVIGIGLFGAKDKDHLLKVVEEW